MADVYEMGSQDVFVTVDSIDRAELKFRNAAQTSEQLRTAATQEYDRLFDAVVELINKHRDSEAFLQSKLSRFVKINTIEGE